MTTTPELPILLNKLADKVENVADQARRLGDTVDGLTPPAYGQMIGRLTELQWSVRQILDAFNVQPDEIRSMFAKDGYGKVLFTYEVIRMSS